MCTSFSLFSPRYAQPLTAMNFDYFVEYKLGLVNDSQLSLQVYNKKYKRYLRPLGINSVGTFMNTQLVNTAKEAEYRPHSATSTTVPALLENILWGRVAPNDIGAYLKQHQVLYRRGSGGVHNMITTAGRDVFVVDPGRGVLHNEDFLDGFAVQTNFALTKHLPISKDNRENIRCQRYQTVYDMLLEEQKVDVDRAFAILEAAKQTEGRLPTIFSMVALPQSGTVYVSVLRDFSKRFRFTFSDGMLRADKGLRQARSHDLTKSRISPHELLTWE